MIKLRLTERKKEAITKQQISINHNISIANDPFKYLLKNCKSIKVKYDNYRFITSKVFTNDKLYRLKMIDSPLCQRCNMEVESIRHKWFDCSNSKLIWAFLNRIMSQMIGKAFNITYNQLIEGVNINVKNRHVCNKLVTYINHKIFGLNKPVNEEIISSWIKQFISLETSNFMQASQAKRKSDAYVINRALVGANGNLTHFLDPELETTAE